MTIAGIPRLTHTRHVIIHAGGERMATDWITTSEAAELSGYPAEHLREPIREGKIDAEKKGNAWWIGLTASTDAAPRTPRCLPRLSTRWPAS